MEPYRDCYQVHFDEQPHAQYLISGAHGSGKVVMEAGAEIVGVVERVRAHAPRLKVTAEGSVHRCGDFTVRPRAYTLTLPLTPSPNPHQVRLGPLHP